MDAMRYRAMKWLCGQEYGLMKHAEKVAGLTTADELSSERFESLADAAVTLAPADVVGSVWKPIETAPAADGVYLFRTPAQKEINAAESVNYRKGDDFVWCARGDYYCFDGVPGCEWTEIPR